MGFFDKTSKVTKLISIWIGVSYYCWTCFLRVEVSIGALGTLYYSRTLVVDFRNSCELIPKTILIRVFKKTSEVTNPISIWAGVSNCFWACFLGVEVLGGALKILCYIWTLVVVLSNTSCFWCVLIAVEISNNALFQEVINKFCEHLFNVFWIFSRNDYRSFIWRWFCSTKFSSCLL